MKRIYVCIGIVVLLLAAAFYSSFRVQQFAEDISDDIDTAMEDIRNSDLTGARQALAEGAELCDTMREGMNHLLRTQDFTELEAALRAADGHLELNAPEEAFGELRRAQVLTGREDEIYQHRDRICNDDEIHHPLKCRYIEEKCVHDRPDKIYEPEQVRYQEPLAERDHIVKRAVHRIIVPDVIKTLHKGEKQPEYGPENQQLQVTELIRIQLAEAKSAKICFKHFP